jgi:phage terminase large subunit GpA-like protein
VIISSPGTRGVSHIEREMDQSTKEYWHLPCPQCHAMQVLEWERIRFSDFTHRCIECNEYSAKFEWLAGKGEWRASRPFDERGQKVKTRGFYLSGLYNPWIEWEIFYEEWVQAVKAEQEGDIEPIKAFNNTRLGLLHEEHGQKIEIDLYEERREVYAGQVPAGVVVLTSGVDVHERQLNYEIVGWGRGRESWGIEYGMLDGDPREPEVWQLLDEAVFNRVLVTHDGKLMKVRKMAVDSGYASDFVYAYTKPRQPRAISIRGEGGLGKPFIKGAGTLTKSNQARLITLGVDTGKEEIVNRLLVNAPGPGYCHFPKRADGEPECGYDEEYFKGLTAERRIVKAKHGFHTYIWIKRLSQRNEPFDCRNYALGCVAMPMTGINLATMNRDEFHRPDPGDVKPARFGVQKPGEQWQSHGTERGPSKFGAKNRPLA